MPPPTSLAKRNQAREKALAAQKERVQQIRARQQAKALTAPDADAIQAVDALPSASSFQPLPPQPWKSVKAGSASLAFASRAQPDVPVLVQPWASALTDDVLVAAKSGGVVLALVWPARIDSLVPLHALANLERNIAADLCGLRTLLYPGTHTSAGPLQSFLVNRGALTDMYRRLWVEVEGKTVRRAATESDSFTAVLAALNDIRNHASEVPHPAAAETVPTFVFSGEAWRTTVSQPLERSLRKVSRLAHRRQIRDGINSNWSNYKTAPGALLVVHGGLGRTGWKAAFGALNQPGVLPPEAMLIDATWACQRNHQKAFARIPEFLAYARDQGFSKAGAVIVTDDPKTFFVLRKRLADSNFRVEAKAYAAEAEHVLLSPDPRAPGWKPETKSNANFTVGIVDRDAASVAVTFHRLAHEVGDDDGAGHRALMEACLYVLRVSNMPAGFTDLTESAAAGELDVYSMERNSWPSVQLRIHAALDAGAMGDQRKQVEDALARARSLIAAWTDATPMATRLLSIIERHAAHPKGQLCLVLPNQRYIRLASRYLLRKLGSKWADIEPGLEWHTLASAGKNLSQVGLERKFVFVGANIDVLRILLAHPDIPHGTTVLIAYRQAESLSVTLRSMKELDALKPYRGRIGLLLQELERRLSEVTHPVPNLSRLGDMSFTMKFEEPSGVDPSTDQHYYRFDLEGGRHAYSSGWVYRYEPHEDPFFRRTAVTQIEVGTLVFNMTDELRRKVEEALHVNGGTLGSVVHPERAFLKLYHEDVQRRCAAKFPSSSRTALAAAIHKRMLELDPSVSDCPVERLTYWLTLTEADTRPHAPKHSKYFKVFCSALDISESDTLTYWNFIRNARRLNQNLGRVLAAQYAEILFQPESAVAYRKIPLEMVNQLQQEAIRCVFPVEAVHAPKLAPAPRKAS